MVAAKKNIAILILAAGASSRMGQPKQLLPWEDTTLLGNAIRNARFSEAHSIFVVLGANAERINKEIEDDYIDAIGNPFWESGLGSSIAAGIVFILKKDLRFDGILIMLADQPLIDADYLNSMISSFYDSPKNIIATTYQNRAGVPALFDKAYFNELTNLNQDFGAKALIDKNKNQVFAINPENKAADIDTKSEYQKLIKKLK